ncbi:hypothetical protein [Bradyrhizobium erythrophlei]|uniref:hypothetical protein n=1 Tax=Bradyrhizobium erythrophlei TaxID=1437360 RepID=UPI0012EC35A2|nr:hypothetical protein [Bradyrhizobium erythrophlei]
MNGQQRPKDQDGQLALMAQAQKLLAPAAIPSLQPIQMAKPVGSQGINPLQFLAAFGKNPLSTMQGGAA